MWHVAYVKESPDVLLQALRTLTGKPTADFHPSQREAIESLVTRRERLILVQRTGWGKSAVYFVATHLLRSEGLGATLLISPLLSLMRNQIDAAERLGLRTLSINTDSETTISELATQIEADDVDLIVISPERLANPEFADTVMPLIGRRPGLTVIDEVHCISDWGHDFRPDYQRIGRLLNSYPEGLPILGCTATANKRVMEDARRQLGDAAVVQRGALVRNGLALGVLKLPNQADRLAWLSAHIPTFQGSGIVYCLTTRDVESVTKWLVDAGLNARRYHSRLSSQEKQEAEQELLNGSLKILVATTALGMGYDNPAIGFVVHFQSPGSVVQYYQQVGRAGRALQQSRGVLLCGSEDEDILMWFIDEAFPGELQIREVLDVLDAEEQPVTVHQIGASVNMKLGLIEHVLNQLDVAGVVRRVGWQKYERTLATWTYPTEHVADIARIRRSELAQMLEYADSDGCRMAFLTRALDDDSLAACGICDNCTGTPVSRELDPDEVQQASQFLNEQYGEIKPRARDAHGKRIPENERIAEGRYLCRWGDAGYGELVRRGKQTDGRFADELVAALAHLVARWNFELAPVGVTYIPSDRHPLLVPDLAERLARILGLPLFDILEKTRRVEPQKTMANSAHQGRNVEGAFALRSSSVLPVELGPVILLDDIVDSRWTLTEAGRVLRLEGFPTVYPLALASTAQ